ncbi:hypothetical protein [Salinicoccus sp. HZC-1]|uniref:hypothetical protein n=1 Tax=Salinicoccus sp. HZC-1 TaxID=3385497 RepID=UPI00398AE95E
MLTIMMLIVIAVIIARGIYTHYISGKRESFILSGRKGLLKGPEDEALLAALNTAEREKKFISILIFSFILTVAVYIFIDPVFANWFALFMLLMYFVFGAGLDIMVFKATKDKFIIVRLVIGGLFLFGGVTYFITEGLREPELVMKNNHFVNIVYDIGPSSSNEVNYTRDMFFVYESIDDIEMTNETPDIPVINAVHGIGSRLNGVFNKGGRHNRLLIADRTKDKILLTYEEGNKIYINSRSHEETEEWYEALNAKVEEYSNN